MVTTNGAMSFVTVTEYVASHIIAFVALTLLILLVAFHYSTEIRFPPELPRVREGKGRTRFTLRTRLAYYTDCEALFREAYETVSDSSGDYTEAQERLIVATVFQTWKDLPHSWPWVSR